VLSEPAPVRRTGPTALGAENVAAVREMHDRRGQ